MMTDYEVEREERRLTLRRQADRIDNCILPTLVSVPVLSLIGMAYPLCALLALAVGVVAIAAYLLIE